MVLVHCLLQHWWGLVLDPSCKTKGDDARKAESFAHWVSCEEGYLKEVLVHHQPRVPEVSCQLAALSRLLFQLFCERDPWF